MTGEAALTSTTTERFVASLRNYRYPALPAQALHDGKRALFDCLGAALAASADSWPILGLVEGVAEQTGGVPESSLIGSSMRTNAVTRLSSTGPWRTTATLKVIIRPRTSMRPLSSFLLHSQSGNVRGAAAPTCWQPLSAE